MSYFDVEDLFETANLRFLENERELIESDVSERSLCASLMTYLRDVMRERPYYDGYYVDVEYNRNRGGNVKKIKSILDGRGTVIPITCDLIVHSRGRNWVQDNLLAVEMKKKKNTAQYAHDKRCDQERLIALTMDTYGPEWDRRGLPEYVCRYILGVFYEIDYQTSRINLEYYHHGFRIYTRSISFDGIEIDI